ncbi:MAG TPA: hypothetical protein VFF50_08915 [Candidatus Deferrimicrobiaceae bacterium]|nr:hypothetical protein [Candidatus Deferrimicrobiaceae bacterium]
MSEQRRKQQQKQNPVEEPTNSSRKTLIWGGIVLALLVAYGAWWYYTNHRYDGFAKCLAAKQTKMYGLYWCPHCAEQKAMFGKAFQYVPYVECAIKGSRELAPACSAAGVKLFPSWQFGSNPPKEGVYPLEELSDKTGCALP